MNKNVTFDKSTGMKVPLKMWIENPEMGTYAQAINLTSLPFAFHHVALMPDAHQGYGMPIGGVLATRGVVVPNAVGVDIGCGMRAWNTGLRAEKFDADLLKRIMGRIREAVPVGFEHHKEEQVTASGPIGDTFFNAPDIQAVREQIKPARKQIGTLGGGNHFIEIQRSDDGEVWVMIHSGSRNFGYKIAKHYNEQAQRLCRRWHANIPEFKGEDGLAFLPIEDDMGKEYFKAMEYAVWFAERNRAWMMGKIRDVFFMEIPGYFPGDDDEEYDVRHNYAAWENHFGENVIVHRKGATSARKGEIGIVPGSQGTCSYIVRGLGNPDSFMSCSHGAGRRMSRTEACRSLSLEEEIRKMDEKGIVHGMRNQLDLDEAAGAYKDIDEVMANQTDLVEVVTRLTPMAVIKG